MRNYVRYSYLFFIEITVVFFAVGTLYPQNYNFFNELKFEKSKVTPDYKFIKTIVRSNRYLWVASASGFSRVEIASNREQKFLPGIYITSIAVEDDEQNVWLGTVNGLIQLNVANLKRVDYRKDNSKLSDNRINTLLLDKGFLYIGNQFGVDKLQIASNIWVTYTAIEGLAGNNIQSLKKDFDYIWAAGADGISYYEENEDLWNSFGPQQGLRATLTTDLVVDANYVWVATAGGGLAKFDRSVERFEMLTSEDSGLIDDSVQALIDDGAFLWVATFDGLSLLEKSKERFINYHTKDGINEPSVYCGAVVGNRLLLGTDSGGIYEVNKRLPNIQFNVRSVGYEKPGSIAFYADLYNDVAIKSWSLRYRELQTVNIQWLDKNISYNNVALGYNRKVGVLNDVELKDGKYIVQLQVEGVNGIVNTTQSIFIVDKTKPDAKIFFRNPEAGEKVIKLTGRYTEDNLKSIRIYSGTTEIPQREIELDRLQKRFRFPYVVERQESIKVIIEDIAGNRFEEEKSFIVDRDPPKLTVNDLSEKDIRGNAIVISGTVEDKNMKLQEGVIINPGAVFATLSVIDSEKFSFRAEVPIHKEGIVEFQITAFDLTDKSTMVRKSINFTAKDPAVFYDPTLKNYSLRDKYEIRGNLLGPLPDQFKITQGDIPIRINADKSFAVTLQLTEGKNTYKVLLIHRESNTRLERDFEIEYIVKPVGAELQIPSRNFAEGNVTLRGVADRGATRVMFNNITAKLNLQNFGFDVEMLLKEGRNEVEVSVVDEIGRVVKFKEILIFDKTPPNLLIRPLPSRTGLKRLPIKGKINDISDFNISVFPAASIERFSADSGEFEGYAELITGSNLITFEAIDKSGNRAKKDFKVIYHPDLPPIESDASGNEELITQLREEIRQLKELLSKKGGTVVPDYDAMNIIKLPQTAGLVLMPFHGKTKNYQSAAQFYLGNEKWATEIAGFNGVDPLNISRILIPTPRLYALISNFSASNSARNLIQHAGRSFMNAPNTESVKRSVLQYLTRTRQLKNIQNLAPQSQLYILSNQTAVFIHGGYLPSTAIEQAKKNLALREVLVASINAGGLNFSRQ